MMLPERRSWRPGMLLWLTFALHAVVIALLLWQPSAWRMGLGFLVANHILLTAVGLWPKSRALGVNWVRLPQAAQSARQIALTIDDGPDPELTPKVLDILDRYQARATFFCIGSEAARHPELCREIIRRGHAVENHSQQHLRRFSALSPGRMAREVAVGQTTLTQITGQPPLFFRAPAGLRSPFLEPILARQGLILASWTRRGFDTRNRNADDVLQRLTCNLAAGDILLLHDGHAARDVSGVAVILTVLPRLLEIIRAKQLHPVTLRAALGSA